MRATVAETREVAKGTQRVLFAVDDHPDYRPWANFWVGLPDRGGNAADGEGVADPVRAAGVPDDLVLSDKFSGY